MMEKDKEKLENRKRAREEEEKRKVEEEKRRKLARDQRQSDLCSGRQNPAMKTAGILPLTNKNWASSARQGKTEEAIAEEARRRDERKSSGLSSEGEWKKYLAIVQKKGLKDCDSLEERIAMLRRAAAGDSQVLYVSHLAKTLALNGKEEEAKRWMGEWGKLTSQGSVEATRWKRASLSLELRLARKTDPQASLKKDQWKAGWRKFNVNSEEVKAEVSRQAGRPLYLFDVTDENLVKVNVAWKPLSKDSVGAWNQ